jgi:magnesium transporter
MSFDVTQLARQITYHADSRVTRFRALSLPEQSVVFSQLSPHLQHTLIKQLRDYELVDILDHMDLREAERLTARIGNVRRRDRIVAALRGAVRDKLDYFVRFHPKATVSLIHFNYLWLPDSMTIGATADAIDEYYDDTGRFPEVLVHKDGVLVGEVPMSALVRERNSQKLKKFVQPVSTVPYLAEVADIMQALTSSRKKKVLVLDHDDSVLGIVYADEALALFGESIDASLYDVAGVDDSEQPFDGAVVKFKRRYRWLILNLLTCFLAGWVIYLFEDTVEALIIITMYVPIVAGMGGNAAAQAFAVTLRGLTLGTVSLKNCWSAVGREAGSGLLNGLLIGLLVALISVVWNKDPLLGLVVGLTMVGEHLMAVLAGTIIPIFIKKLGKDPAATSTIFITTVTDVGGLVLLLGLATLLLM